MIYALCFATIKYYYGYTVIPGLGSRWMLIDSVDISVNARSFQSYTNSV